MGRLFAFNQKLAAAAIAVSAAGLFLTVVFIGWQIFSRYLLSSSPDWSERLTLFVMNIYIFFTVAVGVREEFHLGLTFFRDALPAQAALVAKLVINVLIGLFGFAMIIYGTQYAASAWSHTIPTLGISQGLGYAPIPIAGIIIVAFVLEHIVRVISKLKDS